ncbi:hypothetical protein [Methylobacterium nigriterrae]|uniref:hypothetical protein n=1 Tax=Methylobacterium nigriterrae TaxID=3127512 RepID=UPI003013B205
MPKAARCRAFLITVIQRHEERRTYAVMKATAEEALETVRSMSVLGTRAYLVGALSRDTVRQLKLKCDDVRFV